MSLGKRDDDEQSITGGLYEAPPVTAVRGDPPTAAASGGSSAVRGVSAEGITRESPPVYKSYGRGPVVPDRRKFRYDRTRGLVMSPISFGASKADRLDAGLAGDMLDRIHTIVGIEAEPENVLAAFDRALFFEHTINGASLLQPGRGVLYVGESEFDLGPIKSVLGAEQRRFFRAFADDIAANNRFVLDAYDPYNPVACERYGQIMQVAVERGLQKYPYLAHDSSDAGLRLSVEERMALINSKRVVLESTVNNADKLPRRSGAAHEDRRDAGN